MVFFKTFPEQKRVCLIRHLHKIQQPVNNEIHLEQTPDLSDKTHKVKWINYSSNFNSITEKMAKLRRLLKQGVIDKDLLRYLPAINNIAYQGMIYAIKTKKSQVIHLITSEGA